MSHLSSHTTYAEDENGNTLRDQPIARIVPAERTFYANPRR